MNKLRWERLPRLAIPGALLFTLGGCLGPNPGFFVTTSAANAAISTLVNSFLGGFLLPSAG